MNINAIQGSVNAAQSSVGIQKAQEARRAEQIAPEQAQPARKPVQAPDEYVPEDKAAHAPIGLYRVVQEDGAPKIEFDDPEKAAPAKAPEKAPEEEKFSETTMNTDKVDREIERLKAKQPAKSLSRGKIQKQ